MRKIITALTSILLLLFASPAFAQPNLPQQALNHIPVCPGPAGPGNARCHAQVVADPQGKPITNATPSGYGPAQFLGAYNLSQTAAPGTTIAIVDAYDYPNAFSDLNTYSNTFGIPKMNSCTISGTSTNCFQKVNQTGGTSSYPRYNSNWALESALDVQTAHAICQNCNLLLVEANSNSYTDLLAAEDYASSHAKIVSNSWGSSEFSSETGLDSHFNKPNVAITFSSGDGGYGAEYPAASQYVTAVGGTTLNVINNGNGTYSYYGESVWSGAGSGCSAYEVKPSWQTDPNCSNRTIADVSADADPNTGAAIYMSTTTVRGRKTTTSGTWYQVGGTSLASPLIASVYALNGNTSGSANQLPYTLGNASNLHDVTSGSNGSCGGTYLCTATTGYDGPTGLGTPNGTGAF